MYVYYNLSKVSLWTALHAPLDGRLFALAGLTKRTGHCHVHVAAVRRTRIEPDWRKTSWPQTCRRHSDCCRVFGRCQCHCDAAAMTLREPKLCEARFWLVSVICVKSVNLRITDWLTMILWNMLSYE